MKPDLIISLILVLSSCKNIGINCGGKTNISNDTINITYFESFTFNQHSRLEDLKQNYSNDDTALKEILLLQSKIKRLNLTIDRLKHDQSLPRISKGKDVLKRIGEQQNIELQEIKLEVSQSSKILGDKKAAKQLLQKWSAIPQVWQIALIKTTFPDLKFGNATLAVKQKILSASCLYINTPPLVECLPSNLSVFYHFNNLTELSIDGHNYTSAAIAQLLEVAPQLKTLSINDNLVQDLSFLKVENQLKKLSIRNNYLNSLEGIQLADSLIELDFSHNTIDDITPLLSLNQLRIVDASQNNILDINGIRQLPNLKNLSLFDNPIQDCSPLLLISSNIYLQCSDTIKCDTLILRRKFKEQITFN